MSLFYLPRASGFDTNGALMSGARLYFYTAGTSTPKNTYSDVDLTTANANPVVANSAGLFGPIFLASGSYKVTLTDSSGTQIWSQDDFSLDLSAYPYSQGGTGAVNTTVGAKLQERVTFQDFGAVGDGATNDTTAIQNAIDDAAFEIDGLGKTYRVDVTITKTLSTSGWRKKIKNAVFDFSNNAISSDRIFDITGTLGTGVTPSTISAGATTATFTSTAAYAADNWLLFKSANVFATEEGVTNGEWNQVRAVDSGTALSFQRAFHLGYSTTPLVYKPTLIESIIFEDCHFIGSGNAYDQEAVRVTYAKHVAFIRCTSEKMAAYNCTSISNIHLQAHDCDFGVADDASGLAYGITVGNSHESVNISGINGTGLRHVVTLGGTDGVIFNAQVSGITGAGLTDSIVDSHAGVAWLNVSGVSGSFRGGQSSSEGDGIVLQGAYVNVSDVTLNGPERHGVLIQPSSSVSDDFAIVRNVAVHQQGTSTASSCAGFSLSFNKGAGNMKIVDIQGSVYSTQTDSLGVVISADTSHADGAVNEVNIDVRANTPGPGVETQASATGYTITRLNIAGSYERQNTTAENLLFAAPGSADIATVCLNINTLTGGTYSIRNVNSTNVSRIVGSVRRVVGYGTGPTTGSGMRVRLTDFQETATGTFTAYPEGVTLINSTSGAVTCTLGSGNYSGQLKTFTMNDASNSSTLSVTNHLTSDPEVFTFAQVDDTLVLMWAVNDWVTISNNGVTT